MSFLSEDDCLNSFWIMRDGILQYIPVKIILASINIFDLWGYNWIPGSNIIYYIAATIASISVSVAMYYLVFFFHTLHEELVIL